EDRAVQLPELDVLPSARGQGREPAARFEQKGNDEGGVFRTELAVGPLETLSHRLAASDPPPRRIDPFEQVLLCPLAFHVLEVFEGLAVRRARAEPLALVHAAAQGGQLGER